MKRYQSVDMYGRKRCSEALSWVMEHCQGYVTYAAIAKTPGDHVIHLNSDSPYATGMRYYFLDDESGHSDLMLFLLRWS